MESGWDTAEFALGLALKQNVEFADVRFEQSAYNGFLLKNGIAELSSFEDSRGIGIRVIVNKTAGFASTNNLSKEGIRTAVNAAVKDAGSCSKLKNSVRLWSGKPEIADYIVKEKVPLADVAPDERVKALLDVDRTILGTRIGVPFRYLSLSDTVDEKYYVNSEGSRIFSRIPRVNFYYYITLVDGNKTAQRYWQYGKSAGFEAVADFNLPNVLKDEVLAIKKNMDAGVKSPKGKVDVVVSPQITGIMVHESGGHPYEADRILGREAAQAGESFISKDDIGTSIGSDAVNISDDPTLPNSFGFYLYDDEGIKAGKKQLVKKGVISEFLHSRETAAEINAVPNASGRATGYDREPIARMSNTFMEPGELSEEELIESVKKGVYIKNFTEWNIDDRRVNQKYVGAEAYIIRNGMLESPVVKPTIEITTHALYRAIDAVADNTEYHAGTCGKGEPMQALPVLFGGPSLRIRGISLK